MRPKRALEPWPLIPTSPQFSCAIKSSKQLYPFVDVDPWQVCQFSQTAALYAPESSFIFFCPSFFHFPDIPADLSTRSCPEVKDNSWAKNERNLYEYQTYVVIHELVHFYLQSHSLSGITTPPEQYGIDGCVALSPLNSLHNPTNYQAYVSSKFIVVLHKCLEVHLTFLTAVVQHGCTQSPDPYRPPYIMPDRELATVPGLNISYMNEQISQNSTYLATTDYDSRVAASVATA